MKIRPENLDISGAERVSGGRQSVFWGVNCKVSNSFDINNDNSHCSCVVELAKFRPKALIKVDQVEHC